MITSGGLKSTNSTEFQPLELELASRNHAAFPELLAQETTPIGGHYLIIHFDVPVIDEKTWKLQINGLVNSPLALSLADLYAMPATTRAVTLECAGNGRTLMFPRMITQPWRTDGVSTAVWKGVRLADVLSAAGVKSEAINIVFEGRDRGVSAGIEHNYGRSLSCSEAMNPDMLLAYEMNGQPLPAIHGYPLRLLCPGWYGMASVKWLETITATSVEFDGPQQSVYYRYTQSADDAGIPVTRMKPRSLIAPPGIPDESRMRHVNSGNVPLIGKAWSGYGAISQVDISTDGGATWSSADIQPARDRHVWQTFTFSWNAHPGRYRLYSRAADDAGNVQPVAPIWNFQGLGNNVISHVDVTVR